MPKQPDSLAVHYSHVHIYCDSLRPLAEYRRLEAKLNDFASELSGMSPTSGAALDLVRGRQAWLGLADKHPEVNVGSAGSEMYKPSGQDLVEQLLVGLGWRVTGSHNGSETQSLVVTSEDPKGVKFVLTAHSALTLNELATSGEEGALAKRQRLGTEELSQRFDHFQVNNLERFSRYHNGRQGVAVLGFEVPRGGVKLIHEKYAELHPTLLVSGGPHIYGYAQVLEVYAYYQGELSRSEPDPGTILRFVEAGDQPDFWALPGVQRTDAKFDGMSQAAYCDHWVSNVFDREGFLKILEDTLGFTPKVDFNAGVVAAGEAQIESTVTGNSPGLLLSDKTSALKDQSQVYLPINNALSEVGHVHVFLKELGQGIQHIASRVSDLGALVQRANDYRKMTGAGFSFLQIPRSYYGYLTAKRLAQEAGLELQEAEKCLFALRQAGVVDARDLVELEATPEVVAAALPKELHHPRLAASEAVSEVVKLVLRARYGNLYSLLREHVSEATYLLIVRNNILVDIQGEDLLLQIFTSKVLQRGEGEESPFLEFIQRVCSECVDKTTGCPRAIKPGCGGFGIRNFLTLFLSIEVSKAVSARAEAERQGNAKAAELEGRRVDAFTAQLDESNPILTAISDAMTAEGLALEQGDSVEAARWAAEKVKGQQALQAVSNRYKDIMKQLREDELAS